MAGIYSEGTARERVEKVLKEGVLGVCLKDESKTSFEINSNGMV